MSSFLVIHILSLKLLGSIGTLLSVRSNYRGMFFDNLKKQSRILVLLNPEIFFLFLNKVPRQERDAVTLRESEEQCIWEHAWYLLRQST